MIFCIFKHIPFIPFHFKGYLQRKTINSQNVPSEAQVKNFSF